jgi:hypothetical protein
MTIHGMPTSRLSLVRRGEASQLSVLADVVEADRELTSQLQFGSIIIERNVLQSTENQPFLIVAVIDADPHPFTDSRGIVWKLNFDEIALLVCSHSPILVM